MTLISLVSKDKWSTIPVLFAFKERVKRYVFIYDTAEAKIAKELQEGLLNLLKKYRLKASIDMIAVDEDNQENILSTLQKLPKKEEIFINTTGADETVATLLGNQLLLKGAKIIAYDKNENSYNIIGTNSLHNTTLTPTMKLQDAFLLLGIKLIRQENKMEIFAISDLLEKLFRRPERLFELRLLLQKRDFNTIKKDYGNLWQILQKLGIKEDISSFGHLFEKYLFLKLNRFDFDDIMIGAQLEFDKEENISITNEFDILTIKNNKIAFVEAKFGSLNSTNPAYLIYKNDALMDYFGQDAKSAIFMIEPSSFNKKFTPI